MKTLILGAIMTFSLSSFASNLYEQSIKTIEGKEVKLSQYKGKALLFVNIATQCGYTGQLEGLEAINKKYSKKGLVVIGVPSNDFGGQTPESEKEVAKFCKLNYGVSFPLTAKTSVKGKDKHPVIKSLIDQAKSKDEIAWNFEKFLVNKDGQLVDRFKSSVKPESKELTSKIESVL